MLFIGGAAILPEIERIGGVKKVMCLKTLMQRIDREFAVMKESIISKLSNVDVICTTADIVCPI